MNTQLKLKLALPFLCIALLWIHAVLADSTVHLQEKITELKKEVLSDTALVRQMLDEVGPISLSSQQQAIYRAKQALSLANKINYQKGIADATLEIADLQIYLDNSDSVQVLCEEAKKIYEALGDTLGIARVLSTLGYTTYMRGEYGRSKSYYDEAIQLFRSLNYLKGIALAQNHRGLILWSEGNYSEALNSFQQAIPFTPWAINNIGIIYLELNQDSLALEYFNKMLVHCDTVGDELGRSVILSNLGETYLHLKQDSTALKHFEQSLNISEELGNLEGIAFSKKYIGLLTANLGQTEEGIKHIHDGLETYKQISHLEGIGFCHAILGKIYTEMGAYELAIKHSLESLNLGKQLKSKQLISQSAETLALAYKMENKFSKALEFTELYHVYKDSLINSNNIRQLEGVQFAHQLEKKEIENSKLVQQKELQEAKNDKQLLFLLIISLGFLIAVLLLLMIWKTSRARKKINNILNEQKRQIIFQNKELLATNQKLSELDREKDGLMSIVAHDLKSPLNRTQGLTQLIRLSGKLTAEQEDYLKLIDKVVKDGGKLINDLLTLNEASQTTLPLNNTPINIVAWTKNLLISYQGPAKEKEIEIHFQPLENEHSVTADESALARIFDNLISNALKFSEPKKNIYIKQTLTTAGISISVQDEGPGISEGDQQKLFLKFQRLSAQPTHGESSTGLGLAIVKALVEKIGGNVYVTSEIGKGTTFTVQLPLSLKPHLKLSGELEPEEV